MNTTNPAKEQHTQMYNAYLAKTMIPYFILAKPRKPYWTKLKQVGFLESVYFCNLLNLQYLFKVDLHAYMDLKTHVFLHLQGSIATYLL